MTMKMIEGEDVKRERAALEYLLENKINCSCCDSDESYRDTVVEVAKILGFAVEWKHVESLQPASPKRWHGRIVGRIG